MYSSNVETFMNADGVRGSNSLLEYEWNKL